MPVRYARFTVSAMQADMPYSPTPRLQQLIATLTLYHVTYSRGHNKVPVPFASPFRATVLTVSVPFPFRVRVWPCVRLNGRVRSVFLGCCGKV